MRSGRSPVEEGFGFSVGVCPPPLPLPPCTSLLQAGMPPGSGVLGNRVLDLVLMLGCLLAVVFCLEVEPQVFVAAGEGAGLEASMHSSFLQEVQDASDGSRTEDLAGPGWVLDPWAVVGRLFQLKLPHQEEVYLGDVIQVRSDSDHIRLEVT